MLRHFRAVGRKRRGRSDVSKEQAICGEKTGQDKRG